ncbi:MAG: DUF4149 domain-containing protein [Candidatus Kapaibacteriota bacterium]|jgi:hypothetical protein
MSERITPRTLFAAALLFYFGMIVWLGSLAFFGIGVAPVIFKTLPSKDLAGALNAVILHRLNMVELAGAACVGVSFALGASYHERKYVVTQLALLGVMIGLWGVYAYILTPQMNNLRGQINSFDTPDAASLLLVQTFRSYHQWYSRLVGANMLLGASLLVLQTRYFFRQAPVISG